MKALFFVLAFVFDMLQIFKKHIFGINDKFLAISDKDKRREKGYDKCVKTDFGAIRRQNVKNIQDHIKHHCRLRG